MAVRAGMQDLIDELRRLTNVSVSEYSDQELQDKLDQYKTEYRDVSLQATRTNTADGVIYQIYDLPESVGDWFELPIDNVVNSYFNLRTSAYVPVVFGTIVDFDADMRRITFVEDTGGVYYYLTLQTYDMYGAAADIWQVKCIEASNLVDIKTDNHTLALSQSKDSICGWVSYYASRSLAAKNTRLERNDQALSYGRNRIVRGFVSVWDTWDGRLY